jgi:two-component system LytT family sensor kinase
LNDANDRMRMVAGIMVLGSFYRKTFDMDHSDTSAAAFFSRVIKLVLSFWAAEFFMTGGLWVVLGVNPVDYAPIKLVVSLVCVLITLMISHIVAMMRARNIAAQVFVSAVLSILASTVATTIDYHLFTYVKPAVGVDYTIENFCYTLFYGVSLFFGWSCFFIAYMYNLKVRAQERRLAISREEALTAKMQALYYQINPHFLFNTLSSISSLTRSQPETARMLILKLSGLLRRLLRSQDHFVTLREELEAIDEYLDIESIRFGPSLKIEKHIDPATLALVVPSMILQPLVENSIKHGLAQKLGDGRITIRSLRERDHAIIDVIDNGIGIPAGDANRVRGTGIGLRNVNERLRVIYGANYQLQLDSVPGQGTCARIVIPEATAAERITA